MTTSFIKVPRDQTIALHSSELKDEVVRKSVSYFYINPTSAVNRTSVQPPPQIWHWHKTWFSGFFKMNPELPYMPGGFCVDSENTIYLPCISSFPATPSLLQFPHS